MTSKEITRRLLYILYSRGYPIFTVNFQRGGFREADILGVTKAGFTAEYEIKVSRSDFFADFKKRYKHMRMSDSLKKDLYNKKALFKIPNYFYYAVPEGLIKPEEVPDYAGLVYLTNVGFRIHYPTQMILTEKRAPKLHKYKLEQNDRLIHGMMQHLSRKFLFKMYSPYGG